MFTSMSCFKPGVIGLSHLNDYGAIAPDDFEWYELLSHTSLKPIKIQPPNITEMFTSMSCFKSEVIGLSPLSKVGVIAPGDFEWYEL